MNAQHTPGPWVVAQRNYEDITVMAHTDAPRSVCDIVGRMPIDMVAALRSALPLLQADADRDHGDQQLTAAAETRLARARAALAAAESAP